MVCLVQAKAVSIEGHPNAAYNGLYTHDSTHEGWPVLKNAKGRYCYRHAPRDEWLLTSGSRLRILRQKFDPGSVTCAACIVAKEGPLPVGARAWKVAVDGKLVDGTLTVGLLA